MLACCIRPTLPRLLRPGRYRSGTTPAESMKPMPRRVLLRVDTLQAHAGFLDMILVREVDGWVVERHDTLRLMCRRGRLSDSRSRGLPSVRVSDFSRCRYRSETTTELLTPPYWLLTRAVDAAQGGFSAGTACSGVVATCSLLATGLPGSVREVARRD